MLNNIDIYFILKTGCILYFFNIFIFILNVLYNNYINFFPGN